MSTEAKVGAFTLGGLALLTAVVIYLSGFQLGGSKGYTVYAGFGQVVGLSPQATVCLSGVPVGRVRSIENDGGGVMVALDIQSDVKVPRGSAVTLASSGVMGEKFINILPGTMSGDWLQDGDYVYGQDEQGMDAMFAGLSKVIVQVQELLGSVNDILGNPQLKDSVIQMSINMRDATAHISSTMAELEIMLQENRGDVRQIAQNLSVMTSSLNRTANSVERMVDDFAGDGTSAANLKATLQNLADASARVERMAAAIEGVVTDPQTAEDIRETLHNARGVTEKANKMLGKVSKIKVTPSAEVMYNGKHDHYKTNLDVNIDNGEGGSLLFGLEDIGEGNKVNAQVGKRKGNFGARAGVVAGKVGLGVDAYAGKKWKFSAEAYDMNDVIVRMRAQYEVHEDTYLLGEVDDVANKDDRRAYFGLRRSF